MPISTVNSTTTPLLAGASFTGGWISIDTNVASISVAGSASHASTLFAEFSTNDATADRTLKLNSSSTDFGVHSLSPVMKFFRIRCVNEGIDQTAIDIQTMTYIYSRLSMPTSRTGGPFDSYSDCLAVKPTNTAINQIALGEHQGASIHNKFGYNSDVDTGSDEVLASFGGVFNPLTTASTLSIVSTSTEEASGGTGVLTILIEGIDANRDRATETVTLTGTSAVVTTSTWLGINSISTASAGSSQTNVGTITATAVTGSTIQAQMPIGKSISQQVIYFVPRYSTALMTHLMLKGNKIATADVILEYKVVIFDVTSNAKSTVFSFLIDTRIENTLTLNLDTPFAVSPSSVVYVTVNSDTANAVCIARLSLTEFENF
jgi:hypothetical protein